MRKTLRSNLRGWLELLRIPNLPTVPGDPLAGYLLASGTINGTGGWWTPATAALIALCLYACGLLLNDVADFEEDRRARPKRPLPSGRITRRAATVAAAVTAIVALALGFALSPAVGIVACMLLAAVLAYTFPARRRPRVGIAVMGSCRGLSVLLGASAATRGSCLCPPVAVAAFVAAAYIMAVSAVALRETEHMRVGLKRFVPGLVGTVGVAAVFATVGRAPYLAICWGIVLAARGLRNAVRLRGVPEPPVVSASVGHFIRDVVLMQAALCAVAAGGAWASIAIAGMWPLSRLLARRFYGS